MSINPETNIQFLKGVGEKRASLYRKLDINTIRDLLYYFPRSYIDLSKPTYITEATPGEIAALKVQILSKSQEQHIRKGLSVFKVKVCDDSADLIVTFFNAKYTVDSLQIGEEYIFYGKITGQGSRRECSSPMIFPADLPSNFIPIYSQTQGLTSKMINSNAVQALHLLDEEFPDPIPNQIRAKYNLCHLHYALTNVHIPSSADAIQIAKRRLVFEEFFILSLSLGAVKRKHISHTSYQCSPDTQTETLTQFNSSLPFTLTNAQQKAIDDVLKDMCNSSPMNRLIQGDVGSGKTMVAAAGCFFAFQNGYQSALMAPTEILAQQHYLGLAKLLEPFGMRLALLTGSTTAKEKRNIKENMMLGIIDLVIGTHALLSEDVYFQKLALVITDEQHRFGVAQRTRLAEKSDHPHTLVMSATPIPRTLGLIVYGDLDISIIDELPPNRSPVNTYLIRSNQKLRAYHFIQNHLDKGLQAYIVCPLVEAGETDSNLIDVEAYAAELSEGHFHGYSVGVLHGKMKPKMKEKIMSRFQSGEIQLLVSTTVVEVGVDVPNAVIMMIENAERFGLSQLHQLRGRVGRGSEQSSCILVSDTRSDDTRQRLNVMRQTNDGFQVAEYDLKSRGPGDFLGKRQHGLPQLKIADMSTDMDILLQAQEAAQNAYDHRTDFTKQERSLLNEYILRLMKNVGERLN